jgi:hypothetical protein
MALSVFGDKPAGLTSFVDSGVTGDDFRMAEHVGKAVIVSVRGPVEKATANYGVKTAISCDVVVLDDDKGNGTKYEDVLIFNAAPVSQMKDKAGQTIAAVIVSYDTKQGGQAPKFDEPTADVVKAAEAYLAKKG